MGCTSSTAAAGGAAPQAPGPTQEDVLRANTSPKSGATTSQLPVVAASSLSHKRSTSVVPLYPTLASELPTAASSASSLPPPPPPPPSAASADLRPTSPPSSSQCLSPSMVQLPLPASPSHISRSLPAPLPAVRTVHGARPFSQTFRPGEVAAVSAAAGAGRPMSPRAAAAVSMDGSAMSGTDSLRWKSGGASVAASTDGSAEGSVKGSARGSRRASFNSLLEAASPSLNLCDPAFTSSRIADCFVHYARKRYESDRVRGLKPERPPSRAGGAEAAAAAEEPPRMEKEKSTSEEESIDKKALGQLATDCVLSLLLALRRELAVRHKDDKSRDKKEKELRARYLPGQTLEDSVELSRLYLQQELQYRHSAVTRTMFFYHFARCFKAMFVYEKMSIEREQLIDKWNTQGRLKLEERRKKDSTRKEKDKDRQGAAAETADDEATSRGGKESSRKSKGGKEGKKKRSKRATAPANSISDLMHSTSSKVMQAEKKLTSTLSAASGDRSGAAAASSSSGSASAAKHHHHHTGKKSRADDEEPVLS